MESVGRIESCPADEQQQAPRVNSVSRDQISTSEALHRCLLGERCGKRRLCK